MFQNKLEEDRQEKFIGQEVDSKHMCNYAYSNKESSLNELTESKNIVHNGIVFMV